ncbi:hypothetical protein EC23916_A0114 [Escherichia coli 2.3916]|nr:hypothetical protein EC23916_A0114 [Escherichia coli 2.3916]
MVDILFIANHIFSLQYQCAILLLDRLDAEYKPALLCSLAPCQAFFYFIMEAVNALDLAELIERTLLTLPKSSPNSDITLAKPRRASSSVAFITKCSALRILLTGNATDIESISGILSLNFTVTMTAGD